MTTVLRNVGGTSSENAESSDQGSHSPYTSASCQRVLLPFVVWLLQTLLCGVASVVRYFW